MTTYAPAASIISHASDAAFRQTVTDFLNQVTNGSWSLGGTIFANVAQTSDTGQMTTTTLSTAVRPAANTALASNGYFVLTFNDTQKTAAPIFIKFEFGTGSTTSTLGVWTTIGTSAAAGNGTIGNITHARTQWNLVPLTGAPTLNSYSCCVDGAFAMIFKNLGIATTGNSFLFCVGRTSNPTTGAPTADGWLTLIGTSNANTAGVAVNAAGTGTALTSSVAMSTITGGLTATLVGGVAQVFPFFCALPGGFGVIDLLSCLQSELPAATPFTATAFGSTSHTYMPITLGGSQLCNTLAQTGVNLCIIWE